MRVKFNIKIGFDNFTLESEATDLKDQFVELYGMRPRWKCDICGNTDTNKYRLYCNKTDEGYKYVKVICTNCEAQSTLGTYKDNKGYFWKKFEPYVKDESVKTGIKTTKNRTHEELAAEDYMA